MNPSVPDTPGGVMTRVPAVVLFAGAGGSSIGLPPTMARVLAAANRPVHVEAAA